MEKIDQFHDKKYADRLTAFRRQYIHKRQIHAAAILGIPQSNLSYMESGKIPIKHEFVAQLVKTFGLNTDWFDNGNGKPTDKNPPKKGILTDINLLNEEIELLNRGIKILQANQNYMLKRMEEMEQQLAKKS